MPARFARFLAAVLLASCIAAPAFASGASPGTDQATIAAETALRLLESVERIEVGADATVVTIRNGRKPHPIIIGYGDALQTGSLGAGRGSPGSHGEKGGSAADALSRGFSLGQLGAVLLGLTVVSRGLRVVRQLAPARRR